MENNKVEISRSFSATKQIAQYEPVNIFCAAKMEVSKDEMEKESQELFEFCRDQVRKDMVKVMKVGRSKNEQKEIAKETSELEISE